MAQTFKTAVKQEKHSFMAEAIIIGVLIMALFLYVSWYGLKKQDEVLEGMNDLSENLVELTDKFGGAYKVLEARQEEARRSTEAVQNGLNTLSFAIGEMTDALNAQKAVSSDLAKAKRGAVRTVPKKATQQDINRFKKALQ